MRKSIFTIMLTLQPLMSWCTEMPREVQYKLDTLHEQTFLSNWEELSECQQQKLASQIHAIDPTAVLQEKEILRNPHASEAFEPFQDYYTANSSEHAALGNQLISEGKVGCLVLAGGQGTRLGFCGPKGMYPISAIHQKTLFQLLAEKVAAASKAYQKSLPLAVMTSPVNDAETKAHFLDNNFFGLDPNQVFFFSQEMFPFLDEQGKMFLESSDSIALGPNGNGYALHLFYSSGTYQEWKKIGVSYVNVVLVDNPLADPFDATLVGFQHQRNDEVTFKSIKREDPKESIGVIVRRGNKLNVVEYSEISDDDRSAKDENGSLKHPCGSISLFSFSMDFICRIANHHKQMPLHKAFKKTSKLGDDSGKFYAWKFEAFIFDVLNWADKVGVLVFQRENCFAPLKNAQGSNSPETVRAAILERERKIVFALTGVTPLHSAFELPAEYYYPTPEMFMEWKKNRNSSQEID